MAEDFDEIGSWPGRGDWPGRAERIAEWDGVTPWEKKSTRDIATECELTPKQMHKLMTIWRPYLKATRASVQPLMKVAMRSSRRQKSRLAATTA